MPHVNLRPASSLVQEGPPPKIRRRRKKNTLGGGKEGVWVRVGGHILSMSNRLVNNHCQQELTKDQKSAIVIFGQCRWALTSFGWKKDTGSPVHPSCRPPASPRSGFLSVPSADNGEACCIAGESHGITSVSLRITDILWQGWCCCGAPGSSRAFWGCTVASGPPQPPCLPTSLSFLYCVAMFDRHRAYNNLLPAGTCTICLADPTNSFNPLSPCLVLTAVAHRHRLINAASLFIFTSCSLFESPPPPCASLNPHI